MKTTILIVDDHKMIRDGYKSILNESKLYQVVGEACDGHEALIRLKEQPADIVLMDLKMPNMDGLACCKAIRKMDFETKILVLSMHIDQHLIMQMLEAGVNGYLSKGEGKIELIEALACINKGNFYYEKVIVSPLMSYKNYLNQNRKIADNSINLTKREIEVLKLIMAERSNKEIADQLSVSVRTVDGHRRNLLQKTGAKNTVGMVKFGLEILNKH